MEENRKFRLLSESQKEELIEDYIRELKANFMSDNIPVRNGLYKYDVMIQEQRFITYMTDAGLREAARYALELLEELKNINNSGMNKAAFEELEKAVEKETESDIIRVLSVWGKISTEKTAELIAKIEVLRRVGGAFAMFFARPMFCNVLYAVFDVTVDRFDDEEWYWASGFFLLRAIMKMNSEPVSE